MDLLDSVSYFALCVSKFSDPVSQVNLLFYRHLRNFFVQFPYLVWIINADLVSDVLRCYLGIFNFAYCTTEC